ncbi:DUF937 domain-containing protein [bacterium]|nr:DUF937 domain-containing protein [bacterium]
MLDQLLSSAQGPLKELLGQFQGIDPDQAEKAGATLNQSLAEGIQEQVKNGDRSALDELLSGAETPADHPALGALNSKAITDITSKLGIDADQAQKMVQQALPMVMNFFNQQAGAAKGQGNDLVGQITSALNGQGGFDLQGMMKQLGGADGFDMNDLKELGKKFF